MYQTPDDENLACSNIVVVVSLKQMSDEKQYKIPDI